MSDANRVQLRYCPEDTWGVSPATRDLTEIRWTGESLSFNIRNTVSNEIRTDRQITDLVQTGAEPGGGFSFELSYGNFDDFLAGALWGDWATPDTITGLTASAAGDQLFVSAGTAGERFVPGQWIKVAGMPNAASANNGFYQVIAALPGTLTVTPSIGITQASATLGSACTITGSMLRNGVTRKSFTLEKKFADLSPVPYMAFAGMVVNGFSLSARANSILTGNFDFIGKGATVATNDPVSSGGIVDANSNDVFNAVANLGEIREDGVDVADCLVQGIDITLNNNVRGKPSIGNLGFCGTGVGRVNVTGTLTAYFQSTALYKKFLNSAESSFSFKVEDNDGNAYIFTLHRIKFETDNLNATGADTDVMENISYQAIRHPAFDCTIQVDRFPA